jgi:hypothetical protein
VAPVKLYQGFRDDEVRRLLYSVIGNWLRPDHLAKRNEACRLSASGGRVGDSFASGERPTFEAHASISSACVNSMEGEINYRSYTFENEKFRE